MSFPICLNSNTYHGFTLDDAIEGASIAGIRYIEIAAVAGYTEHVSPSWDDRRIDDLLSTLASRGLRVLALGGHSDLTSASGRADFERNLQLGARLGADYVVTGTGATHGDETHISDEDAFAETLRGLGSLASDLGVRIALETHGANYPTGAALLRLIESVDSPSVGIAYDTGNTIFYGGVEPYEDLAQASPAIIGLHLKDKNGGREVWDFPAIGEGEIDFLRVHDALRRGRASTGSPLSIEIEFTPDGPRSVDDVHGAVARSVSHLRSIAFGSEGSA